MRRCPLPPPHLRRHPLLQWTRVLPTPSVAPIPPCLQRLQFFSYICLVDLLHGGFDPDYNDVFEGSLRTYKDLLNFTSGKERQYSVFNVFQEVEGGSELVCVHDSARPLVSSEDVKRS